MIRVREFKLKAVLKSKVYSKWSKIEAKAAEVKLGAKVSFI
jgi:hypothetical protein